jgi:anti-sigma-K factor RskA
MNIPAEEGDYNLRYAEYVLGVLDADTRAAVALEIENSTEAAAAVALWERRLLPLADEIAEVAPSPNVWVRIRNTLQLGAPARMRPADGIWNNLPLWHWIGIGASIVAAACLLLLINPLPLAPTRGGGSAGYMVSSIQQDNGVTDWTATMDLRNARMVVVPVTPVRFAQGRAPELWLIPAGQKPLSVGVIATDKPVTLVLDPVMLARLGPTAVLAVSVEPIGGSPTGQPTGAVIAKGPISGAPDVHSHTAHVVSIDDRHTGGAPS